MMTDVVLASRLASLKESATLALNAKVKLMAANGATIYNLTAGELATDTPEYIQKAVAKSLKYNKYTPVAGLPDLREVIARHARHFYGLEWIKASNVVVTAGAKPALYASFLSILDDGDEVIVPVPGWTTSYTPLIELAGGKVVEVPLNELFDLNVDVIDSMITSKTRAIIVNSPNNPTGSIYSKTSLDKLSSILKSTSIVVIADDIYSKLVYTDDFTLVPTCNFNNLIIVNGFSKSQALTGWRIGYIIASSSIAEAATSLLSHITGNAPLPSQYAALEAIKRDDMPPKATMSALNNQRQMAIDGLKNAGIACNSPKGAFYIFMDLRHLTNNSAQWCEDLLTETGVALVPGEAFSAPGFARLTFVADESSLMPALKAIQQFAGAPK